MDDGVDNADGAAAPVTPSTDVVVALWWQQQRRRRQLHLLRARAALCAIQMHRLLLSSIHFAAEPRHYPTRCARVDLSSLSESDCILRFRFTLPEIERIGDAMGLPEYIKVNRVRCDRAYALAMLLYKLAWPHRNSDIAPNMGLDSSSTGRIINEIATWIVGMYGPHLDLWPGVTPAHIARCAAAISALTPAIQDIWGFIDGTSRKIARPELNQRGNYSGYKRTHCHNFQGVVTPDGLIVSCMGPFIGSKNDLNMLDETGLQATLEPMVRQPGRTLMLYGDLIYKGQSLVLRGYERATSPEHLAYNKFMSGQRVSIETGFGRVMQLFTGTDLKRMQRSGLSPTTAYYLCGVLFTNVYTCMHPETSNVPWLLEPPTVEEYLS